MRKFIAFTLSEVLIVLVLIGVLTAILMPVAFQAAPDENVMKFKKAHSTFYTVINELIQSDKYYKDGWLGAKPDGSRVDGRDSDANKEHNRKYFCQTIAEIMTTKSVNCSTADHSVASTYILLSNGTYDSTSPASPYSVTKDGIADSKKDLDTACLNAASTVGAEIVTTDNVVWYQTKARYTFGAVLTAGGNIFSKPGDIPKFHDENNMDIAYKIFCIDVDGIGKGEAPFGYGIRGDGKILNGARADEWLQKSSQKGGN